MLGGRGPGESGTWVMSDWWFRETEFSVCTELHRACPLWSEVWEDSLEATAGRHRYVRRPRPAPAPESCLPTEPRADLTRGVTGWAVLLDLCANTQTHLERDSERQAVPERACACWPR